LREKSARIRASLEEARLRDIAERDDIIEYTGEFDTAKVRVREFYN